MPMRDKETQPNETLEREAPAVSLEEAAEASEPQAPQQDERHDETDALVSEVEILRDELHKAQEALTEAKQHADELKDKYLRARADLDNYRRRQGQELERARDAGLDSAVLTVLAVYDDLSRALSMATDDPAKLIPGVEAVKSGLERNLEALGITAFGSKGEAFDPDLHEALSTVPLAEGAEPGTIAEVFQVGFKRDERLIRPARVTVYQEQT